MSCKQPQSPDNSRRIFLEAAAAGAVGLSTDLMSQTTAAKEKPQTAPPGVLSLRSARSIPARAATDLHLRFKTNVKLQPGARLWLFYDIRQHAEVGQIKDAAAANALSVKVAGRDEPSITIQTPPIPRTLDLFPTAPEFLHLIEVTLDKQESGVAPGKSLDFMIRRWTAPKQPIDPFRFWLVVDDQAKWELAPIGFRRYRKFVERIGKRRVPTEDLLRQTVAADLKVTGRYPAVPKISHRKTPGIFWGEFHGMVFNQRPLDDYYSYARRVAKLDFCAPFWFSYNTCVGDVWERVKVAAARHTQPGKFVAIAGFECGTPPDDSHRCVLFPDATKVPPIFCDSRPPAQEPFFQRRFHPRTIVCKSVDELYEAVKKYGGVVTGHFHTRRYHKEVLAELFQKNLTQPEKEEQRLYELMRSGKRFALAATSDTHDSMPGNPYPEPHLPMAAGFTGVYAAELTPAALFEALLARRIFATSGARIVVRFHSNGRPMGAELPRQAKRKFELEIEGTADLKLVELLRDGRPIQQWSPQKRVFAASYQDASPENSRPKQPAVFYLVRVTQADQHRAWSSPIWFG